jgi:hypothetical protein
MRERSSGRMFTVDDDPRHVDDGESDNLSHDAALEPNGDE